MGGEGGGFPAEILDLICEKGGADADCMDIKFRMGGGEGWSLSMFSYFEEEHPQRHVSPQ